MHLLHNLPGTTYNKTLLYQIGVIVQFYEIKCTKIYALALIMKVQKCLLILWKLLDHIRDSINFGTYTGCTFIIPSKASWSKVRLVEDVSGFSVQSHRDHLCMFRT